MPRNGQAILMDLTSRELSRGLLAGLQGGVVRPLDPGHRDLLRVGGPRLGCSATFRASGVGRTSARHSRSSISRVEIRDPETLPCLKSRESRSGIVARATDSRTSSRRACAAPGVPGLNKLLPVLPLATRRREGRGVRAWPPEFHPPRLVCAPFRGDPRDLLPCHLEPLPRPSSDGVQPAPGPRQSPVARACSASAADDRFADWAACLGVECGPIEADEKQDHIRELDAVVAHLYGLSEDQLVHVFETFHEGLGLRRAPSNHPPPLPDLEGRPMSHPEFVDNLDGNTLERALREHLDHLLGTLREPPAVSIATGYFNPGGFGRLADVLRRAARRAPPPWCRTRTSRETAGTSTRRAARRALREEACGRGARA